MVCDMYKFEEMTAEEIADAMNAAIDAVDEEETETEEVEEEEESE